MWDIWKRAWTRQPEECVTPTTSLTKRRFEDDPSSPAQESKRPRRTTNGTNGYPSYCTEEDLKILGAAKENDLIAVVYDVQVKNYIAAALCDAAIRADSERVREGQWKRIVIYIVDDGDETRDQAAALLTLQPQHRIVSYTEVIADSDDQRWLDFMASDIVVLSSKDFGQQFEAGRIAFSQISLFIIEKPERALLPDHPLHLPLSSFTSVAETERPHIFGIILPQGGQFNFGVQHIQLEGLIDAEFYGIPSQTRAEVAALLDQPKELVVRFNPPAKISETPLFKHLKTLDKREEVYRREFRRAKAILREVGSFASDWVWRRALKSMEEDPMAPIFEEEEDIVADSAIREAKIKADVYRVIKNWTFTMPNLDSTSKGFNVTPKIAKLVQILQCFQHEGDGFRGVIFVQRRLTALALVEVLRTTSEHIPFIRPEALTGPWNHDRLPQRAVLEDFQLGICNLLVSTRIGEDGIEIPRATCVIRYDLFDSHVSSAQVRSVADGSGSHVIFMQDKNSDLSRKIVRKMARAPPALKRWTQTVAVKKTGAFPPMSLDDSNDAWHSDSEDDEDHFADYIKDPTMSGLIYPQDSVGVIYRYLSKLSQKQDAEAIQENVFEFTEKPGAPTPWVCNLVFPPGAPLSVVQGPAGVSQVAAKRAVCFKACQDLYEKGLLSYEFFPRPKEVVRKLRPVAVFIDEEEEQTKGEVLPTLPPAPMPPNTTPDEVAAAQATQATESTVNQTVTGTRCYKRKKPEFWANTSTVYLGKWYPTIITVDRNHNPEKPYRPIVVFTRRALPTINDFKLYFSRMPSVAYLRPGLPVDIDEGRMQLLYRYTLRVMRSIVNKAYTCEYNDMPFFIAPLAFDWDIQVGMTPPKWPFPDVLGFIPWEQVMFAAEQYLVPLRTETPQALEADIQDSIIQDRWTEFTRRYDCIRVRPELNPLSKLDNTDRNAKDAKYENVFEWCKAKRKGFEGLVDYAQPLIEVSNLPAIINRLQPTARTFDTAGGPIKLSTKFVIPELCSKFTIPASTMRTLTLLPSIMKRVDETLLVLEFNSMYFNNEIDGNALQAAISAPSAGLEIDYERLELLGDAYLKYLSSIYLFVTNPTMHEGMLHIARQKIISNKSLLVNSDKSGLPQYVQSKPFIAKMWLPLGYKVIKSLGKGDAAEEEEDDEKAKGEFASVENKKEQPKEVSMMDVDGLRMEQKTQEAEMVTGEMDVEMDVDTPPTDGASKVNGAPIRGGPKTIKEVRKPVKTVGNVKVVKKPKRAWLDDDHQWLGDKGVADVAEAIIGAAFQTGGRELGLKVVKSLHIPLPFIESWEDFALKAKAPPPHVTVALKDDVLETIETIVGTKFRRPHILAQALTHNSVHGNDMTCYERLEFLGDAILDFLVIQHIFDLHGQLSPGALTLLKGAMVSNSVLAAVSVHHGLHKFLMIESESVKNAIDKYVPELEENQREEYALAEKEGRMPGQYWLEVDPPKSIADVVESILGAIYVSDGFKVDGAQLMYNTILRPFYDKHITLKTLSHHPTKVLFELFQSRGCQVFEITKEIDEEDESLIRCDVIVHDIILACGYDYTSTTFAARRASFEALDALEGDPEFMSRNCDCRQKAEQRKAAKRAAKAKLKKPAPKPEESEDDDNV